MGSVVRPPSLVRQLLGLDEKLRGVEVHAGGRRWGPQEPWHYFGDPGEPGLISPWAPAPAARGFHAPRWYRDERDTVHFSGVLWKTSGAEQEKLFAMPAGLRSPTIWRVAAPVNEMPAGWEQWGDQNYPLIQHPGDGIVRLADTRHWFADDDYLSLDGLSYDLDP